MSELIQAWHTWAIAGAVLTAIELATATGVALGFALGAFVAAALLAAGVLDGWHASAILLAYALVSAGSAFVLARAFSRRRGAKDINEIRPEGNRDERKRLARQARRLDEHERAGGQDRAGPSSRD